VAAFTVNQTTGGLTQNGSAPFATGLAPMRITLHSGGKFLYTANSGDGTISGFAIDAASGNLMAVSGSPFRIFAIPPSGGLISFDVAIDLSGQFLYAANPTTNSVSGFRIDASTGSLSALGQTSLTGHGPVSFTIVKLP